jgi:hypothetical protein
MPKGPIRPRAGFTPLLRLLGLIAFAILIVVLLLLWVQSCQEDKKRDAYSSYMTSMKAVGDDSQRVGRELSDALTTQGIKPAELQKQLRDGKSLADIAKDKSKAVDGLEAAIVAGATTQLAAAVAAGDLTDAQRDQALTRLKNSVDELVAHTPGLRGDHADKGMPGSDRTIC